MNSPIFVTSSASAIRSATTSVHTAPRNRQAEFFFNSLYRIDGDHSSTLALQQRLRLPKVIVKTAIREPVFIFDAQVHVWGPNTPQRPWRTGHPPRRAKPLTPENLPDEMRAAGVARAVLVPPYINCERNDLLIAAAQKYPD